ncbi:unnamed protein product [Parascedosporium putredinis]|uniref:Peptidase A1 domain-containing protein n=1 Tax=Parascedosporium putredinis TaxID=1442378 RepID=A0A9P1MF25_9PEZI|nr:unnamed protein product [Parascedosporium putredinis]CAI8004105.1 unnamed protein product [Parascedosporium putredinis]
MRAPAKDTLAVHYQSIKPIKGRATGRSAASVLRAAGARVPGAGYQNITALLDSSTHCVSQFGTARSTCSCGPSFVDNFRYGQDPELHFSVTFGSGESVTGPLGRSDLSVAGLTANVVGSEGTFAFQYSFYTIAVDGIQYGQITDLTKYLYIIDTGTTLMHLPPNVAEAIAHSFEPRGTYIFQYGGYFAACDAVAPRVAVIIEGARFWVNPSDLIYREFQDPATGMCMLGITSGPSRPGTTKLPQSDKL